MPNRLGVLKHQVPLWLAMPPLASVVLQVTEASRGHGGSGAYYVYLRRN
jgi:DNA-nicking Smr family endonuclease